MTRDEVVKRRLLGAGALVIAAAALAYIAYGNIGENLVYYWTPSELLDAGPRGIGPTIRLGGQVMPGTVDWKPERQELRFRVTDGRRDVAVFSDKAPAQMFREGIGVVVEGVFGKDGVFRAARLMVKHDNEYRAPHPGESPKKTFESLADDST